MATSPIADPHTVTVHRTAAVDVVSELARPWSPAKWLTTPVREQRIYA